MSTSVATPPSAETIFIQTALIGWNQALGRLDKLFSSLSEETMLTPIAPGKNRPVYLLGHLSAVHDALLSQMRLGEPGYPHLVAPFLKQPDGAATEIPSVSDLLAAWKAVNESLNAQFAALTPEQWLERHSAVSEEDFPTQPNRNRLALLLSRTSHASYHLGQLLLFLK
jgi:hypothetical protein